MEPSQKLLIKCKNPKCNKTFIKTGRKIYCEPKCQCRDSANRQYLKLKDGGAFKEKRRAYFKIYWAKNREKLLPAMRVYGLKYFFKKRDEKLKQAATENVEENENVN
jgi:hypothetical protein